MDDTKNFIEECTKEISTMGGEGLRQHSMQWHLANAPYKYTYHFRWMGLPIIQYPQDIVAMQELIWDIKPDLIIETGIARGGSLIFYASLMKMMDIDGEVLGIDIDIREHNRKAIEFHPMAKYITMIQGSSITDEVMHQVHTLAKGKKSVMVVLDSNHTHEHVLSELRAYAPLVTIGSYLVVFDTVVEDLPDELWDNRPWGKGNNPKTAVWEFLKETDRFEIDTSIHNKLQITVAPDGYLRCIK
ncbi:cephalosporin hydroxylase family protein [Maridesulfovibrio ferrireducens]|uniref:cephalosporin hydroxylase family protein n=1 Tax=Maridesulfovibrio ferrireducens TaxID=246191 RepID=UPI001A2A30A8|nr:cephalosporin hydroxylase family protein [Maridesulfovibrio ferrireducens]MBI9113156.1 cephalosporin hydroxylase family protein [Maridesulfovibrio ferrireducens]